MGYKISWLAARGMPPESLLDHFGLMSTGEADEANEAAFSIAELPTGWTILWSNDQAFPTIACCQALSYIAPVVSCWVNETVMFSSCNYFENGDSRWFVGHDSQNGIYHIESEGILPSKFTEVSERLFAAQESEGGEASDVDLVFDIPLELAESICGFKHDKWQFDWGEPKFIAAAGSTSGADGAKRGLFKRFFRGN